MDGPRWFPLPLGLELALILPQTLGCCVLRTREAFGTVLPVGVETGYRQHGPHVALSHLSVLSTPWVSFVFSLQLSERARERKVPVTRIGRLANFGGEVATFPVLPLPYCPALFVLVGGGGHCTLRWKWLGIKPCASTGEHVAALP